MATRVFRRDEHEFLRLTALVNPDWDELRQLAQRGLDWVYLRRLAMEHQLNGVAAWRCLAPELDGLVPESARAECQARLADLDSHRRTWTEQAGEALAPLEQAGVPYVMASSVPAYAQLGIPHWPREWGDIDVCIPSERWREVKDLLASAGVAEHSPAVAYLSRRETPDRLALEILTWGPDYDYLEQGIAGAPFLFEQIARYRLCECEATAPAPEAWLWLLADRLYGAISWTGAPLPVWGFARLHNIAASAGFDWAKLLGHMRVWNQRMQVQRDLLATFPEGERPGNKREPLLSAATNTALLLWVLRRTEELYPSSVPTSFFDRAANEFGEPPPAICTSAADDLGPMTFCWWHQPPTLEGMMFDECRVEGMQARIDAGWWRLVEPVEWHSLAAPHWARQHLSPRLPRATK